MLFNSYKFIFVFFPLVYFVSKYSPRIFILPWIVLTSFLFYAYAGHAWFLIPMLITTVFDYFVAINIAEQNDPKKKKLVLTLSLIINLGMLFYFKYSYFLIDSIWESVHFFGMTSDHIPAWINSLKIILPAGISFYTFQTMSYTIDVYRGHAHAEKNFWKFAGFVSYFPHLVAGPLTRHNQLLPQLEKLNHDGVKSNLENGIYLFVIGLAKKILIADNIALIIDPMIEARTHQGFSLSWLVLLGYTLQLYFDFSGYSDMAIGISRMFGIELPQNFNSPYKSLNPSDFWKRWHISLSSWLRDYLYISLGGNRKRRTLNLFLTMLLGGIWHGANWTFVIWGAYHGILLIIYHQIESQWNKMPKFCQRIAMFILAAIGWCFFRAHNITEMSFWLKQLFSFNFSIPENIQLTNLGILLVVGLIIVNFFPAASQFNFKKMNRLWQIPLALLFLITLMLMNNGAKFLYFQF